jgi:NADP-dependent 3-hydroxy acid dehydrogenase YdfG
MVITGASSGLGKELTEYFATKNFVVCALARSEDKLAKIADAYPENVFPYTCDISKSQDVKDAFAKIVKDHKRIDILINNAGIFQQDKSFLKDGFECIDATIDVNLKGTMYCSYAATQDMLKRKDGIIINIASRSGVYGNSSGPAALNSPICFGDYTASKHGVMGFADDFGRGLLANGIYMTSLCPGGIRTPMSAEWNVDPEKLIQPKQIADLIDFVIKQEKNVLFKNMLFIPTHEWH